MCAAMDVKCGGGASPRWGGHHFERAFERPPFVFKRATYPALEVFYTFW